MQEEQITTNKRVIGLVEKVILRSNGGNREIEAKVDTGATKSSIDINLAKELGLGPIIKSRVIKSANSSKIRPIIEADIEVADLKMRSEFTLADRSHLQYDMLIGQNILKKGFLIDPSK